MPTSSDPTCPSGHTGWLAYLECTQYFYYQNGVVLGVPYACPEGTLYSKSLQYCDWEENVQCNKAPIAPSKAPTPLPVTSYPFTSPPVTQAPFTTSPTPTPVQSPVTASPVDLDCNSSLKMNTNAVYYQSWDVWGDRCAVVHPNDIDVEGMGYTHLIYAFASISTSLEIKAITLTASISTWSIRLIPSVVDVLKINKTMLVNFECPKSCLFSSLIILAVNRCCIL